METLDHKTNLSKLWITIKVIDEKSPRKAENEAILYDDCLLSSPKQIANYFNRREITRKSLMSAVTFIMDQVITGISNCSNTRVLGPDNLSIFHLKNLGPRAIEYLNALLNYSVTSCRIPAIWKSAIVIHIPKPGKDSYLGMSYR